MKKILVPEIITNWGSSSFEGIDHLAIPRGQMKWLREFLERNQIKWSFEDSRAKGIPFEVSWNESFQPHDYQLKGVDFLKKFQQGFWCYDPGAGKTIFALYGISELKLTTLILVNSNELAKQWRTKIKKFLHYDQEIGLIQQSKIDIKPITIALVPTLNNWDKEALSKLNEYFGILIHDEAHHSSSGGSQWVLGPLSQKYRIALTASKTRKDGLEFLAYDYYDKIRQIEKGNVLIPKVIQINTGVEFQWTKFMRWSTISKKLAKNKQRNYLIASEIIEDVQAGHKVLSISNMTHSAKEIHKMLLDKGIKSKLLLGTTDFDLERIDKEVSSGEIEVICSCRLFDEGIDIPALSSVHLSSPSSNIENLRQRTGRVTRVFPGKPQPIIKDYKDNVIPCFHSAKKRLEWYKEFGYSVNNSFMARSFGWF